MGVIVAPQDLVTTLGLSELPEPVADRLRLFAAGAAKGGLARKTVGGLISDGRLFVAWCQANGHGWLPAAPAAVVSFIEGLTATRKPATVSRYVASIAKWHEVAGYPSPTATELVSMALRAHRRFRGSRQTQATGLGAQLLAPLVRHLVAEIEHADPQHRLAALRDRALIMVAHDSLARASELVEMRRADLVVDGQGDGTILIRHSKEDQVGDGSRRWLDRSTVDAVLEWLAVEEDELARRAAAEPGRHAALQARRFDRKGAPQGRRRPDGAPLPAAATPLDWTQTPYLFRGLSHHYEFAEAFDSTGKRVKGPMTRALGWSERLSTSSISRIIKRRLNEIGMPMVGFSAHSTRVGKAQDLLADGFDILQVMNAGGWASPQMVARYGENVLAARGAVAQQAARHRRAS